jgi:hypothetical protein
MRSDHDDLDCRIRRFQFYIEREKRILSNCTDPDPAYRAALARGSAAVITMFEEKIEAVQAEAIRRAFAQFRCDIELLPVKLPGDQSLAPSRRTAHA